MKIDSDIIICSLPDYDDLVAEVYISNEFICLISQEGRRGEYVIEFNHQNKLTPLPLDIFIKSVENAKNKLSAIG